MCHAEFSNKKRSNILSTLLSLGCTLSLFIFSNYLDTTAQSTAESSVLLMMMDERSGWQTPQQGLFQLAKELRQMPARQTNVHECAIIIFFFVWKSRTVQRRFWRGCCHRLTTEEEGGGSAPQELVNINGQQHAKRCYSPLTFIIYVFIQRQQLNQTSGRFTILRQNKWYIFWGI